MPSFSAPRAPAAALVLVHLLGWAAACGWLLLDAARGGHAWKQGDWLINAEAVAVRRGLFGSGLLRLSDLTGIGPLAMTVALQLLLLTAAAGLTLAAALRLRVGFRLFLLLVSPGFFLMLWAADPPAGARKELLVLAGLAALAFGTTLRRGREAGAAVLVLLLWLAVLGHEGMILFLPAACAALWLALPGRAGRIAIALAAGGALAAFALNLRPAVLADSAPVCAPLLARGLAPENCTGAISFLTHTPGQELATVAQRLDWTLPFGAPLTFLVAALPLAVWLGAARPDRGVLLAIAASMAAFLPLYGVAVDWGRWITLQISAASYLVLIARAAGRVEEPRHPLSRRAAAALTALALLPGFQHMEARLRGGAIVQIPQEVRALLDR